MLSPRLGVRRAVRVVERGCGALWWGCDPRPVGVTAPPADGPLLTSAVCSGPIGPAGRLLPHKPTDHTGPGVICLLLGRSPPMDRC